MPRDYGRLLGLNQSADGPLAIRVDDWNARLGELFFGFNTSEQTIKYHPTFRSLFSYLVRRGQEGFISPFNHHGAQAEWDKQVNNAYLLGLAWEQAGQLQELKDEDNLLKSIRRAAQSGLLEGMIGTLGNLEAERARLEAEIRKQSEELQSFRVHPRYQEIEEEANALTATIQQLVNANLADGRLIDLYHSSLADDQEPVAEEVIEIYQAVGVAMPDLIRRRLADVQDFHHQILSNRRAYLQSEIQRIEITRSARESQIQVETNRRADLLEVLQTHGALQEYTRLQELHLEIIATKNDIENRISNLRRFEQGRSEVRIKREQLLQTARREFDERREAREHAINLFNSNSQSLYSTPGNLIVDITDTGLKYDVEIIRSRSQGINSMKIFCYDLLVAQLWATKRPASGMLVHDSAIFDGVDERQVAQALELVQQESEQRSFQYICTLNSDTLPLSDFSSNFDLDSFIRLRLTDESEEGGLLGIRY